MEENNELKELSNQLNDSLDQLNLEAVKIRERKAAAIRDAVWWKHSQELMEDIFKNPDRGCKLNCVTS